MENASFQHLSESSNPVVSPRRSFLKKFLANKTAVVFSGIGLVILLGMGTYVLVAQSQKTPVVPSNTDTPTSVTTTSPDTSTDLPTTITPTINPAAAWKSYSNANYGYVIKYPPDWIARDLGNLEPKIPSYLVFNPNTASAGARFITISVSTRSYSEQLTLGSAGSGITVAKIVGTKQSFQDSDSNTSTVITLPRTNNLLVLRTKTAYLTIFNQMISTLQITK